MGMERQRVLYWSIILRKYVKETEDVSRVYFLNQKLVSYGKLLYFCGHK
jgi:hypothetical protein